MEPTEPRSSAIGPSLDHNTLDSLQFNEEIQHLMTVPPENANSFTALLELPAPQAVELVRHSPETNDNAAQNLTVTGDGHHAPYHFHAGPNLTFPSNIALIKRAARFSVFAGEHLNDHNNNNNNNNNNNKNIDNSNNLSPETTALVQSNSSGNRGKVKNEPAESDSNYNPNSSEQLDIKSQSQRSAKRKEREKKAKAATKKSKSGSNSEDVEKLPYVHVRARRGQATDSHSLAERARREKINARMKLLQELVPGCNKISGTALVLDEIISHVQSLQRQVEFLSMRLATVNPRIDFNLDSILAAESGSLMDGNFPSMVMPIMWPEVQVNGSRQQYQLQWHFDGHQQPIWRREGRNFVTPDNSLLSYDSSANSATLHSNQLKMELRS